MKPDYMRIPITFGFFWILVTRAIAQLASPRSALQRQHDRLEREHWQSAGRGVAGANSAALRHQALRQRR